MDNISLNWWAAVLRGAAALLFGFVALIWPPSAVAALVLLFGAYAFADGVFNVIAAIREVRTGRRWGSLLLEGIVSILVGVITLFLPGVTALSLVLLIASWSLITGIAEIVAAVRLRYIEHEWLLGLSGLLSVAIGVIIAAKKATIVQPIGRTSGEASANAGMAPARATATSRKKATLARR